MGIKGLFSFIQNCAEDALVWHKLQNCILVIDGNNLAYDLYSNSSNLNKAYGGDYDKYAVVVIEFFKKLNMCNIEAYVLMDGGHPIYKAKFNTVHERMTNQTAACCKVNPDNQSYQAIFPLLGLSVFINSAQKCGVTVIRCDFEADDDIIVIAKKLGAYVLSNDSDFYVSDVKFILLNTLNMNCIQKEKDKTTGTVSRFIPSYLFCQDNFTEITKVSKELLPLLAPMLGNDVLSKLPMRKFYNQVHNLRPKTGRLTATHKNIFSILNWLQNQPPNPDTVLKKVLKCINVPNHMQDDYDEALWSYNPKESTIESWFEKHSECCPSAKLETKKRKSNYFCYSKIPYDSESFLPPKVEEQMKCTCVKRTQSDLMFGYELPLWFVMAYRSNLIEPIVPNIWNKKYFFTVPQIELQHQESTYVKLEHIVLNIRGLLWSTLRRSSDIRTFNLPKPAGFFRSLLSEACYEKFEEETSSESSSSDDNEIEESVSISEDSSSGDSETDECIKTYENGITDKMEIVTNDSNDNSLINAIEVEKNIIVTKKEDNGNEIVLSCPSVSNTNDKLDAQIIIDKNDSFSEQSREEINTSAMINIDSAVHGSLPKRKRKPKKSEAQSYENFLRERKIPALKWYIREKNELKPVFHKPIHVNKYHGIYPNLFEVNTLSVEEKRKVFYTLTNVEIIFKEKLPEDLEFMLYITCFWYLTYKKSSNFHTLLSFLVGIIMFYIIDGKFGRKRSVQHFSSINEDASKVEKMLLNGSLPEASSLTILELIQSLTREEINSARFSLHKYHSVDPKDNKHTHEKARVHAFSEFQSCFYFINILNGILCFPFPSITIQSFCSGTFCYNIHKCFSFTDCNLKIALNSLFGFNKRIIHLYKRLYNIIEEHLPIQEYDMQQEKLSKETLKGFINRKQKTLRLSNSQIGKVSKKAKKFKKIKEAKIEVSSPEHDMMIDPTEEELQVLANNRFSQLLLVN